MDAQINPTPVSQELPPMPRRTETTFVRMKSPVLATVLSAMPGLGQAYLGYYRQGFLNILIVASLITFLDHGAGSIEPFCGMLLAFFWLFNLVDAARKATQYNQALAGTGERVEDLPKPDKRDTLIAGVAVMLIGILMLLNTRFGFSLAWVGHWWPLILVLTGAYMVATFVMDQRKKDGRTV
jgi:hypothetical protein